MIKILIIGGNGFVGSYFRNILKKNKSFIVSIGTRNPKKENEVLISWGNPEKTYKAISNYDITLNTSKWPENKECIKEILLLILDKGGIWLETTADYVNIEYLFDLKDSFTSSRVSKGSVIHGMGVFPGISNLLIKSFHLNNPDSSLLNLGIRYNLFSGAGKGMCEMMSKSLTNPSLYISQGVIKKDKPIGKEISLTWSEGKAPGNRVALCDIKYLDRITNLQDANAILSFKPSWISKIAGIFNYLPKVKPTQKLLFVAFYLLRGRLLSKIPTKMEMIVSNGVSDYRLLMDDAFISGAESILGFITSTTVGGKEIKKGLYCYDELYNLDDFLNFKENFISDNLILFYKE